jgi:phospholipase C
MLSAADRLRIILPCAWVVGAMTACQSPEALWAEKVQTCVKGGSCAFHAGMLAKDTFPSDWPVGDKIPIDHIVLVMQENRSFDHYFSQLKSGADVAPANVTNPDANGNPIPRFHLTSSTQTVWTPPSGTGGHCFSDTSHGWQDTHTELSYQGVFNNGFVVANDPDGTRAMGYYDETDLPFYYALAQTFALSDRHFCSVLGPTWPNRMFYMAGTSYGLTENFVPPDTNPKTGQLNPNIMRQMDAANITWASYSQDLPTQAIFLTTYGDETATVAGTKHYQPQENFFSDAAAGTLPSVSFVEGSDGSKTYPIAVDEHPPAYNAIGQTFLAKVVQSVMTSPQWAHTALFITYDEAGGLYDHVTPPAAVAPDDFPPDSGNGSFKQYGMRVPFLVVSPYAKRGHVSHEVTDHTSILRFVEARFNLPAMTNRDANAAPAFDMFDFEHPDLSVPTLPAVTIDPTIQSACINAFPPSNGGF